MIELVRNCPIDFKEYYIQMQAAKRSQAPLPSQVTSASHSCFLFAQLSSFDVFSCSCLQRLDGG